MGTLKRRLDDIARKVATRSTGSDAVRIWRIVERHDPNDTPEAAPGERLIIVELWHGEADDGQTTA